ncbi:MAG: Mrp/NBP35 family ATP-binding protein [Bacteroidales bacterium]|nr:Mrp/NBP35 family ATP-binding protein [Bacteroidales bacterium]
MNINKEQVIEILKSVIHPEKGKDIITLDYVKELQVYDGHINFKLEFERVNDPLKNSLKRACEQLIKDRISPDINVDIQLITKLNLSNKKEESPTSKIKNIVAISSGKGGVGKSTLATNLAVAFGKTGAKVGLIDADIYGPSIPKMMGVEDVRPMVEKINDKDMLIPVDAHGIKVLSIGFFVNANDATVWRGPMASNAFQQLINDANWGELDYLFIDLPPGTSDIHLTLVQSVSVNGAVIVSTPQNVAIADVVKGISMFKNPNINVPILGVVENMAWFTPDELPDNKYYIFGKEGCKKVCEELNVPLLGQIPIVQSICEDSDAGQPSVLQKNTVSEAFKTLAENIRLELIKRNANLEPTKKVEMTR